MCAMACLLRSKDNLWVSLLLFYHMGPLFRSWVAKLNTKYPHPPSHPTSPSILFMGIKVYECPVCCPILWERKMWGGDQKKKKG